MILLKHVYKYFDHSATPAIQNVSLGVASGETLVLLGSSGSGKTTLLKMMNRLIEPSQGSIEVDGKNILEIDLTELRHSIGYVFQGGGLFPHMTVEENIAIILRLKNVSVVERLHKAHKLLEMVGLEPPIFAKRFPQELSGGQVQRVAVARSLANDPKVLLMDEPFAALDAINRDVMQYELLQLKNKLAKTVVFVTHDVFEAMRLGDRIAVLNAGRLEQIGNKLEIIKNPATEYVETLFAKSFAQLAKFRTYMDH